MEKNVTANAVVNGGLEVIHPRQRPRWRTPPQPIWEGQEPLYQSLAQQLGDRHLQMDGSYSQRRNARHCFVSLLTSMHHFVVLSAVGSRDELNTTSQGLEPELCARWRTCAPFCRRISRRGTSRSISLPEAIHHLMTSR